MFLPNTRILIVDDMLTMRKLVGKICKELGFSDLTEASDGSKAWEQITNANPAFGLIISDWNMPNGSGIDLLKRLRADSRYGKTPFVLVTAESEASQVAQALVAGVDNYVVKPFDKEALKAKLEAVHKKYAA